MNLKLLLIPILLNLIVTCNISGQEALDEQTCFLKMLQITGADLSKYLDEYSFRFNNDRYHLMKDDEFEQQYAITEIQTEIKKIASNNLYCIYQKSSFGEYDFDNEYFQFEPFPENTEIEIVKNLLVSRQNTNTDIKILLVNGQEIASIPMSKDNARLFIRLRKNLKSGKVNRDVYLKVTFMIENTFDYNSITENRESYLLHTKIHSVEIFDSEDYNAQPLTNLTTAAKAKYEAEK